MDRLDPPSKIRPLMDALALKQDENLKQWVFLDPLFLKIISSENWW
jgi:hypothetical protein